MSMRSPTQTKAESSFTPVQTGLLQRKCATCGQHTIADGECGEYKNKRSPLQRRSTNQAEPSEVPPIVHEVLRSPGQPLDPSTRGFMESSFGHDFSQVRIHTDMKAGEKHLGPSQTHMLGIDDPGQYAQGVEQNTKLSSSTVIDEKLLSSPAQLDAIVTAFGKVEGVENTGIVYRYSGRDRSNDAQLEDWKKKHDFVKALPEATPPEIQALLGCKEFCDKQKQQ